MTHICVSKITIIGSDNGLAPGRRQAIIWTNVVILLIEPLGTNFSEILIAIHIFSLQKMHMNMSSGKWRPFCLDLNVLTHWGRDKWPPYFADNIFIYFYSKKIYEFRLKVQKFFAKGPIYTIATLLQIIAWRRPCAISKGTYSIATLIYQY